MSNSGSDNTGKILGALIAGIAIGAALGILFAPDKGTETRKKILDGSKDLAEDLKEKIKDSFDDLKQRFNDTTSENKA
jgi:gas vesicle protein